MFEKILELWIREGIDCPFDPVAIHQRIMKGQEEGKLKNNFMFLITLGFDIRDFSGKASRL